MPIDFAGQVVLVTGASRGLGKAFAQCLAAANAHVVVNSTGTSNAGDEVVAAIRANGGQAVHIPLQAEDGDRLVEAVVAECGGVHAIVHNAGFVRDKTLRKMTDEQWDQVQNVHLKAAFKMVRAAWPHFAEQGSGRLVFISSSAGLYGNFGQGNYNAAKMGLWGLCQTIALEGAQANICANVVAPFGATELNSANMPEERKALIKTEYVAPLVGYLAHTLCQETGGIFEASGGSFKKVRLERTAGLRLDRSQPMTIDAIAAGWPQLVDFEQSEHPTDMREALAGMYTES